MTQTFIPGTEPPHDPDIESAIVAWWSAKAAQKRAAAETKHAHAAVILHIQHAGLEAYPWTNPDTGRKRNIVITREPKAKETQAPRSSKRGGGAEVGDAIERRERKKRREEEKVEVRRVSRKSVEAELDPFASTRAALEKANHDKPKAKKRK